MADYLNPKTIPTVTQSTGNGGPIRLIGEIRERDGDIRIITYEGATESDEEFLEQSLWIHEGRGNSDWPDRYHYITGSINIKIQVGRPIVDGGSS